MFLIALRNLLQERTRLLISVVGVVFAIVLMLLLVGLYSGELRQLNMFYEKIPTDLIVTKKGIVSLFDGVSFIPTESVEQIASEPGVKQVVPMIFQRAVIERDGKRHHLFIASFVPGKPQGGPWQISSGKIGTSDNEITVSATLAKRLNKKVGDSLEVAGESLKIAGLVPGATTADTNHVWVTLAKARAMTKLPGVVNFVYISLDNPSNVKLAATHLNHNYPDLQVLPKQDFLANNRTELEGIYLPVIKAMVTIAFVIGMAVIGLTIYTATVDKSREYGVLKAIGVTNRQLYLVVLVQALAITVIGLVLGVIVTISLSGLVGALVGVKPLFGTTTIPLLAGLGLVMGVLASCAPVRRLVQIDPAEVFKS